MSIRTYSELMQIPSFEGRFEYLKLGGNVGEETFGFERWMNQEFYRSPEWRRVRRDVIARDNGDDLAHPDYPTNQRIIVHHMNPMSVYDIRHANEDNLNPEFLISVTHNTHNAIHYGDFSLLPQPFVPRRANDTIPWR